MVWAKIYKMEFKIFNKKYKTFFKKLMITFMESIETKKKKLIKKNPNTGEN